MADRFSGFALVKRFIQDVGCHEKRVPKQQRQSIWLIVFLPVAECLSEDSIAHGMSQNVDSFQTRVVLGVIITRTSPLHELLKHAGKREGTLIRRLLIVPIVFHDAQIVVARPDERNH